MTTTSLKWMLNTRRSIKPGEISFQLALLLILKAISLARTYTLYLFKIMVN